MVGHFDSRRSQISVATEFVKINFSFPEPTPLRHVGPLFQLDDVSFAYPNCSPILSKLNLNISPTDKIAFVGKNGQGKSTLVKLLKGALSPSKGLISMHPEAKIGYLDQEIVSELVFKTCKPVEYLKDIYPGLSDAEYRAHLGRYDAGPLGNTPICLLSGGQIVRVAVAAATIREPNILILDEPSNHLDMDTIEALVESIQEYEGAAVVVSHDRYLIDSIAQRILLVKDKSLREVEGKFEDLIL